MASDDNNQSVEFWDICNDIALIIERILGVSLENAQDQASDLFSLGDFLHAEEAGRSVGLSEYETAVAVVLNQWIDMTTETTKIERFLYSGLRKHFSGVNKIAKRLAGDITPQQLSNFRSALEKEHIVGPLRSRELLSDDDNREMTMPEQDGLIKTIKFEILFELGREGDLYWAECMGLVGEGDTMEEALHEAKLSLERWISELLKYGLPIPIGVGATDDRISVVDKIRANFSKREKIVIEIALDGRPLS